MFCHTKRKIQFFNEEVKININRGKKTAYLQLETLLTSTTVRTPLLGTRLSAILNFTNRTKNFPLIDYIVPDTVAVTTKGDLLNSGICHLLGELLPATFLK